MFRKFVLTAFCSAGEHFCNVVIVPLVLSNYRFIKILCSNIDIVCDKVVTVCPKLYKVFKV